MTTSGLKFSTRTKGKRLLIYDGYMYTLNKDRTNVKYWRCQERTCSANIHTDKNDNLKARSGNHNHLSTPESIELVELKHYIKCHVLKESTAVANIYDQELAAAKLTLTALSIAPSSNEPQSSFQRLRRKTTPLLTVSSDFVILDQYSQTLDGKSFLLFDTTIRNKRIIVFATDLQLTILFQSPHIFANGTFDVCPPYFDQVFTIHCTHHAHTIPCIIALLPGRSANIYKHLFELLQQEAKQLRLKFKSDIITTDFEPGLIKAINHQFPTFTHVGCYFYHTPSIYKKINSLGLSNQYKNDEKVRLSARKLMSFALLPINKVELAFECLFKDHPDCLDPLFDYYESFWMESLPLQLWNVSNLNIRTNNTAEV